MHAAEAQQHRHQQLPAHVRAAWRDPVKRGAGQPPAHEADIQARAGASSHCLMCRRDIHTFLPPAVLSIDLDYQSGSPLNMGAYMQKALDEKHAVIADTGNPCPTRRAVCCARCIQHSMLCSAVARCAQRQTGQASAPSSGPDRPCAGDSWFNCQKLKLPPGCECAPRSEWASVPVASCEACRCCATKAAKALLCIASSLAASSRTQSAECVLLLSSVHAFQAQVASAAADLVLC